MRLLFLLAILVAGYLIYKLYFQQLLAEGRAGKIKIGLIVVGLLFLIMAVTGRTSALFGIIGAAMTQAMRIVPLIIKFAPSLSKYFGVPLSPEGLMSNAESRVKTKSLIMTLNHDTGKINGEILTGAFIGKRLSDLTNQELNQFYRDCQEHDPEAVRIIQAYIARERSSWDGEAAQGSDQSPIKSDSVTVREAYDILGLAQGATRQEVTDAHRHLMKQFHPDKGGSNYLAAKVNEAKKVLFSHIVD